MLAVLLLFGYMQLGWFGGGTSEYLISMTAEGGAVISPEDENGCFTVTLKDTESVVWFADRPERSAFRTHVDILVEGWADEFGSNPPNADLQLFQDDLGATVILTLESTPTWEENTRTVSFNKACPIELVDEDSTTEIKPTSIAGSTFSKATLFIDGAQRFHWNACYSQDDSGGDPCVDI